VSNDWNRLEFFQAHIALQRQSLAHIEQGAGRSFGGLALHSAGQAGGSRPDFGYAVPQPIPLALVGQRSMQSAFCSPAAATELRAKTRDKNVRRREIVTKKAGFKGAFFGFTHQIAPKPPLSLT
jgi:hypothetical protein